MRGGVLWEKKTVPGPSKLIGGNLQAGFYGEVPTSDFITGDELAKRIGLSAGVSQFSNEPWLKFSYMGKTEFIAKKTFRHSISWNSINAVNAVFGNRTIKIGDNTYRVRLMKGKTEGKQNDSSAYEGTINHGSEWNKLLLPIHINAPDKWKYPDNVKVPTENWNIGYTDRDLYTDGIKNGVRCWCQEYGDQTAYRLFRGAYGVSVARCFPPTNSSIYEGWRPVLELVD
ncbi:MAG: hypothetical protein ACLVK5_00555 [Peptoniphilus senegalensis]